MMRLFQLFLMSALLCVGLALAQYEAPMLTPKCDAAMIAEHKPTLSKAEYLELVNVLEAGGSVSQSWAEQLRGLIEEAYAAKDLSAWVRGKCAERAA